MSEGRLYTPIFSLHIQKVFNEASWHTYSNFRYSSHYNGVKGVSIPLLPLMNKEISVEYCKKEDLPEKTDSIRSAEKCFLNILIELCPLMDGEHIEGDVFTYLLSPSGLAEKYTTILIRKTNMAELIYFIHSVKLVLPEESNSAEPTLQHLSQTEWTNKVGPYHPKLPKRTVLMLHSVAASAKSVASDITVKLLDYMLQMITNEVGQAFLGPLGKMGLDMFFNVLFPSGVNEFQEVYDMIKNIVKQEIQQSDIDHINGALSNVGNSLQNEYTPRRRELDLSKEGNRQILMNLLQKYDSTFLSGPGGMLGLLQQDNYKKIGLGAYISGVTLQLSIYQECATVDPAKNGDEFFKPLESSYGKAQTGTVAIAAKRAADYVQKTWPAVKADRSNAIHVKTWQEGRVAYHDVVTVPYAKIVDDITGDEWDPQPVSSDKHNPYIIPQSMKDDMAEKQQNAIAMLADQMGNPDDIVAQWQKLVDKPLNM